MTTGRTFWSRTGREHPLAGFRGLNDSRCVFPKGTHLIAVGRFDLREWSKNPSDAEGIEFSRMAQTLVKIYVHIVFSTKSRGELILSEIERELFAYIGGVLRKHQSVLLAANGTSNHIHLLISLSKNIALSDLLRELKKASSYWIKTKDAKFKGFHWQAGFGAFSIGALAGRNGQAVYCQTKGTSQNRAFWRWIP